MFRRSKHNNGAYRLASKTHRHVVWELTSSFPSAQYSIFDTSFFLPTPTRLYDSCANLCKHDSYFSSHPTRTEDHGLGMHPTTLGEWRISKLILHANLEITEQAKGTHRWCAPFLSPTVITYIHLTLTSAFVSKRKLKSPNKKYGTFSYWSLSNLKSEVGCSLNFLWLWTLASWTRITYEFGQKYERVLKLASSP